MFFFFNSSSLGWDRDVLRCIGWEKRWSEANLWMMMMTGQKEEGERLNCWRSINNPKKWAFRKHGHVVMLVNRNKFKVSVPEQQQHRGDSQTGTDWTMYLSFTEKNERWLAVGCVFWIFSQQEWGLADGNIPLKPQRSDDLIPRFLKPRSCPVVPHTDLRDKERVNLRFMNHRIRIVDHLMRRPERIER